MSACMPHVKRQGLFPCEVAGPPEWLPKLTTVDDVGFLVATSGSQPSLFVVIIWIPLKN